MARRDFLACCVFTACLVSGQPPTYHLLGEKLHLMPAVAGQLDNILWTHNGNKVVEFNGREQLVYSPYENRITLDWASAELYITDLRYEDSGGYGLETYANKKFHQFAYTLEVIGKVSKPTISCDMNNGSSDTSGAQATLTCAAEPTHPLSLMKYEWESSGNVSPGHELTIFLEDEHDDKIYSCMVSNPLTNDTATFTPKNCYSEESSSVALTASLIAIFIILLLVGLGILFCKLKHKACFADNVEKRAATQDKEMDQDDELKPLFDRAPTLPSNQRLSNFSEINRNMEPDIPANNHKEDTAINMDTGEEHNMNVQDEMPQPGTVRKRKEQFERRTLGTWRGLEKNSDTDEKTESPPSSPLGRKLSVGQDQDKVSGNDKGDSDPDQLGRPSEKADETKPAGVSDDIEDTRSDVESSTAHEQPELEKKKDEMNPEPDIPANNHKEDTAINMDTREGSEKNSDTDEKTESPPSSPLGRKLSVGQDQDKVSVNDKRDSDHDLYGGPSEKADQTDLADVSDDSEDTRSDVESSTAHEQPGSENNAEKDKKTESPPSSPLGRKLSVGQDQDKVSGNDKGDSDADQLGRPSEKADETNPADLSDDSEDKRSDVESSTAHEQPEAEKEKNEKAKSPPAKGISSPAAQPRPPLTPKSPDMGTEDTTGEHKEDDNSDQVNR